MPVIHWFPSATAWANRLWPLDAATSEHFTGNLTALISALLSDNGKESMSGVLRVENTHMRTIAPEPKGKTWEVTGRFLHPSRTWMARHCRASLCASGPCP